MLNSLVKFVARTNATRSSVRAMVVEPELYDPHKTRHEHPTIAQLTLFIAWLGSIIYYVTQHRNRQHVQDADAEKESDPETALTEVNDSDKPSNHEGHKESSDLGSNPTSVAKKTTTPPAEPTVKNFLQYLAVFGFIMIFFYLCDYKKEDY